MHADTPLSTVLSTADDTGAWTLQDRQLLRGQFSGIRYRASPSPLGPRLAHTLILAANSYRVLATARWDLEDTTMIQGLRFRGPKEELRCGCW